MFPHGSACDAGIKLVANSSCDTDQKHEIHKEELKSPMTLSAKERNRPLRPNRTILIVVTLICTTCDAFSFLSPPPSITHVLEHLLSPPLQTTPLEDLANVRVPGPPGSHVDIMAYMATPTGYDGADEENGKGGGPPVPAIILIHEFFGLNPSIVEKAQGLAEELGCIVVAPDTFRGETTDFIPKAIWLALSTPQDRVNDDLDAVCSYIMKNNGTGGVERKLAVMGFCYEGRKAIRYTTQLRTDAATVIFYGSPETRVDRLRRLEAPVCGIYGSKDVQFSKALIDEFRSSLSKAGIMNDVRIYDGVGHAFWTDMDQISRGDQPHIEAYEQCTSFLRKFFSEK